MADKKQKRLEIDIENLAQAPDVETIVEEINNKMISMEVPLSADKEVVISLQPKSVLSTELPQAPDIEAIQEQPIVTIPLEFPQTPNVELKNVFIPFDGEWMPDSDPIEIGAKNYKTLQNYRYAGDKIIHLESVLGYSKITTNVLPTNYRNIRNGHQLRTEYATTSYNLVYSSYASNKGRIFTCITAPPTIHEGGDWVGTSNATVLHEDAAVDLEGRFSDAPGSQVAYCNGKESCIWAGDEMRCAGFFTIFTPTIVGSTNITFVDNGASADTITKSSGFLAAGFKVGHQIIVTGTTSNNSEFILTGVADGTLTLETGVLTAEANKSATISVSDKSYHTNAKDHTERVNNGLQTEDQIVTIDGDTAGNKWIIFTTRPAQAFKYYIKSRGENATGSATTTCKYWDGTEFISTGGDSDGTDDTNGSMKQTGTFSFTSTDGSARPLHFEGLYLYAYLFELSAGSAEIYQVTVDAPFQDIVDVWDGVYRQPVSFQIARGLAAGSGVSGNSVITTLQVGSIPAGHSFNYIHEVNATDYGNLEIGSEITANSLTRTITAKTAITPISFSPSWAGFAYGSDTTKIQLVNEGDNFQWVGFQPGDTIVVTGTTHNDGSYTLTYLLNGGMTAYCAGATFTAENATGATLSRTAHYYVDTSTAADWYNSGSGYSFTYTPPADGGTSDYKDYTLEVSEPSFADYPIGAVLDGLDNYNHFLIGFEERMSAIQFEMIADLINTNSVKMKVASWNGTQYVTGEAQSDTTYGLPGTHGVNKSFNRTGMVSWNPLDPKDEFRQNLFGVNLYFYEVTLSGALSGTEGGDAEVVIDTVKGIPAQKTLNPFKFSVQYKNRLMLCGFTEGKEGNRIDYSVKDGPDVYNGEESSMDGIQSLYVGGRDDLTGAIEIFNRFGSNLISSLLLYKASETYLLTGDGPENYRIYTISKTIGCPAPLTLAAAETGYTFAEEINRNIVAWTSYAGPMIFDGAAIVPIPGIKSYFDPAKTTRLETDLVERCRGWCDNTYKEYNLVMPSVNGASHCDLWLAYDLVRKRWFEKEPGVSEIPQAAWPVYDTDGVQYIYAGINDGHLMRLENGATWADISATSMSPVIETGDFFPSGDIWDITTIRRVKTVVKKITEANKNLTITWYKDSEASGTALGTAHDLDGGDPISKLTQGAASATPLRGWSHRFNFTPTAFATETQFHPVGWGYQYHIEHDDTRDV